jgi:triacylglycerol esterase/lipase EstA (alpha/beta hydrolase family)
MLARLQRFTTLWLLALAGVAAFWFALAPLLIVFGYALFLALEFVLVAAIHGTDPAPRATPGQLLRAWLGEVTTAPRVFFWRQPFRADVQPDHLGADSRGRRGLVLVHGFFCNRGLWNPWLARLRAQGIPFVAVNLEPVFGSIDAYPAIVDAAVRRVEAATGLAPVVVAHSMGGLAVRAWLATLGDVARVHRVVTIGTPHRGTWLARFALSRNGEQMQPGGGWLDRLAAREPAHRYGRFTCFYSHCDNIVFPASTATLPGADNRHLPAVAHVHMAYHEAVFGEVQRWLGAPPLADPVAQG